MDQDSRKTGRADKEEREQETDSSSAVRIKINDRRRVSAEDEEDEIDEGLTSARDASVESGERGPSDEPDLETLKDQLMEAQTKYREAERQVQDLADRFKKAQSHLKTESDDLRQRLQRNFDQKLDAARRDLVSGLLDTLDNLKRAIRAAESGDKAKPDFDSLLEGVRSTAALFESRMKALGLSEVPSTGEEFDPEIHEAVEIVSSSPKDDNRVVFELQPGYRYGDRLLRPARVRVGRASIEDED
jgi:molecular chaperone GrpE